jgi:hypothetical protein
MDEVKQYLVMDDIVVLSDTKVIRGQVLDKQDRSLWLPIENQIVPVNGFIRAGSIIEKPESLARLMVKAKVYVSTGEVRHFNLEAVFDKQVNFMQVEGMPNKAVTLSDVLRSYSLQTIESVAENSTGYEPLLGNKKTKRGEIKAHDLLRLYAANEEEVQDWLTKAREIITP